MLILHSDGCTRREREFSVHFVSSSTHLPHLPSMFIFRIVCQKTCYLTSFSSLKPQLLCLEVHRQSEWLNEAFPSLPPGQHKLNQLQLLHSPSLRYFWFNPWNFWALTETIPKEKLKVACQWGFRSFYSIQTSWKLCSDLILHSLAFTRFYLLCYTFR